MADNKLVAVPQYACYVHETGVYLGDSKIIARFLEIPVEKIRVPNPIVENCDGVLSMISLSCVEDLWAWMADLREAYQAFKPDGSTAICWQTLYVVMPCGLGKRYDKFDDYPWHNSPCPCGSDSHQIIMYQDLTDEA